MFVLEILIIFTLEKTLCQVSAVARKGEILASYQLAILLKSDVKIICITNSCYFQNLWFFKPKIELFNILYYWIKSQIALVIIPMDEILLKYDNHCLLHKQTCGSQILWFSGEKKYHDIFPFSPIIDLDQSLALVSLHTNIKSKISYYRDSWIIFC